MKRENQTATRTPARGNKKKQPGKKGDGPKKIKIPDVKLSNSERAMFLRNRHAKEIADLTDFTIGPGSARKGGEQC